MEEEKKLQQQRDHFQLQTDLEQKKSKEREVC